MARLGAADGGTAARAELVLGVCVGNRYAAVVVLSGARLVRWSTHTLRHADIAGRSEDIWAVIAALLDGYQPERVVLVATSARLDDEAVPTAIRAWLAATALPVHHLDADDIRRSITPSGNCPSNRALACVLRGQYPELREQHPRSVATTWRRLPPSSTERRHAYLFLALAGALATRSAPRAPDLSHHPEICPESEISA